MKPISVPYSTKLSSRALLYLISIFILISCHDAYPADVELRDLNQNEETSEFNKFRQNYRTMEIYIMYAISLIILQFASLCTLYVILRTFLRWRRIEFSLNMAHKLPFYMALSDLVVYVSLTINLCYPVVNMKLWEGTPCKIVSLAFFYSAISNMILVGCLAVLSYFRVCKTMYYELGMLDYKLFLLPIVLPALISIPAWSHFGPNQYWCYSDRTSTIIPLTLLYVDIATLTISLFCYIAISYAINVVRARNDSTNDITLFLPAYKKIVGYLFIYIIQWTPVMVFVVMDMDRDISMWVYVVCLMSLSIGGILNAVRYISNEGWWLKKESLANITDRSLSTVQTDQMISNSTKSGTSVINQWHSPSETNDNMSELPDASMGEKNYKQSMETGLAI